MQANLEEIFDFFHAGSQRAAGWLACRLFLSHTLEAPSLQGWATLEGGSYDNYYAGAYLKGIQAKAVAQGNQLKLVSLEAKDEKEGTVQGTGKALLDTRLKFPYVLIAQLENFKSIEGDMIVGRLTGPFQITGDKEKAVLQGTLTAVSTEFEIPDELPLTPPALPVTFIHQPLCLDTAPARLGAPFAFHLDLNLTAPHSVFVRGRGLHSEWQGHTHLGGINTTLSARGDLSLVKGEFLFSGKVFSLTSGEITFSDKEGEAALMSLSGKLALDDVTIIALLQGPLASPALSFQSVPPMPTSALLARILFNKDISEISATQAIQLAHAIVSLSGNTAPHLLDTIRKGLGMDRLNLISASDGSDEVALQIGYHLAHGVMVTLSQSRESSQVTIDVALKHGFSLQAETHAPGEGKFSLKWSKSY